VGDCVCCCRPVFVGTCDSLTFSQSRGLCPRGGVLGSWVAG
jgi:hypothetical protein